jgi:hypothetical protein
MYLDRIQYDITLFGWVAENSLAIQGLIKQYHTWTYLAHIAWCRDTDYMLFMFIVHPHCLSHLWSAHKAVCKYHVLMQECPTAQNNTRALCYERSKYQLMQVPSVKTINCDSDVKIILNQYKQWSGNSHNVCVWGWNDNIREFGGSHNCWYIVGIKSLACDFWLPSMYKNWRKLL